MVVTAVRLLRAAQRDCEGASFLQRKTRLSEACEAVRRGEASGVLQEVKGVLVLQQESPSLCCVLLGRLAVDLHTQGVLMRSGEAKRSEDAFREVQTAQSVK